eukprot:1890448-Rhodomonas_salina.1
MADPQVALILPILYVAMGLIRPARYGATGRPVLTVTCVCARARLCLCLCWGAVEDSPSALSDHRKRLEGVLRDQEEGAQEGGGVEEWAAESGEDEHEAEPGSVSAMSAALLVDSAAA